MKPFVFVFLLFICYGSFGQGTGLLFDDDAYANEEVLSLGLNFTDSPLSSSVSLKSYCPTPGNQGSMGSCVGWSTGYGAFTTQIAYQNKINDKQQINSLIRSPLYIYNQIKVTDCNQGSLIGDAMQLLKTKGDCNKSDFHPSDCYTLPTSDIDRIASGYKISDYLAIFETNSDQNTKIKAVKNSISSGKPVVIGMKLTANFETFRGKTWKPDYNQPIIGGHAMAVIGYDDNTKEFEILNSWGTSWGNNGFFNISYSDFAQLTKYGYQMILSKTNPENPRSNTNISGDFAFKKLKDNATLLFQEVTPILKSNNVYELSSSVYKDDFFRLYASNLKKDSYVYVFSLKPDGSTELLFPLSGTYSSNLDGVTVKNIPVAPSNNMTLEIPADKNRGLTTDIKGTDYLCILYSQERIKDISDKINSFSSKSGSFWDRLKSTFGNKLIQPSELKYAQNKMSVSASNANGVIAPIILKVEVN